MRLEDVMVWVWSALGGHDRASLEAVIAPAWTYTWRLILSEFGAALAGHDWPRLETLVNAVIERVWRCSVRPCSTEFGDSLRGIDHPNLGAAILRVMRYTWRLWLTEFGDAPGGHDRARLEEYLEAVKLQAVVQEGGATEGETLFIA